MFSFTYQTSFYFREQSDKKQVAASGRGGKRDRTGRSLTGVLQQVQLGFTAGTSADGKQAQRALSLASGPRQTIKEERIVELFVAQADATSDLHVRVLAHKIEQGLKGAVTLVLGDLLLVITVEQEDGWVPFNTVLLCDNFSKRRVVFPNR